MWSTTEQCSAELRKQNSVPKAIFTGEVNRISLLRGSPVAVAQAEKSTDDK